MKRIIPARAGFTQFGRPTAYDAGDHPRSRGVYESTRRRRTRGSGSSPLARGLLSPFSLMAASARIIPARAGFTARTRRTGPACQDHPRSRGVYTGGDGFEWGVDGSSPLARGLLHPDIGVVGETGIIPARAGFTRPSPYIGPRSRDHPRSRGVYFATFKTPRTRAGSSPLARGLPHPVGRLARRHRIIPARAGFTRASQRRV